MNKTKKFCCIHGHFYQPPRENAWLEVIEIQDGAAPFHDWNERINFECYAPNAKARILDEEGYIIGIENNYADISFNFGPTLLSWMEQADPATYQAILRADELGRERYGHGGAMAQVYSHLIMPLANERDQRTQVAWGLADFRYRFGREAEGMWLAETAVNTTTLEILADFGLKFTVLAPRQAMAVRRSAKDEWTGLAPATVDPRRPYRYELPSGRTITLFFYDGHVSQAVAFEGLLNDGRSLAERIVGTLDASETVQLAHIATDGESYGHHHAKGEMALAGCLKHLKEHQGVTLTNYAAFLAKHPPEWEVRIHENSSWSCVHGVERWRSDCGCNSGGHPGWNQAWRGPLRQAFDWLRDELIPIFETRAADYLINPWAGRDAYIAVILQRTDEQRERFLATHAKRPLEEQELTSLLRLLEMQRNAILMYTSCGWFFDEISGIETNQILQYANRAIYYARQVTGHDLAPGFEEQLAKAPSNVHANGLVSYEENVKPAAVDLSRVGMHFAVASIFEKNPENLALFNYVAESERMDRLVAGQQTLAMGRVTIRSRITLSRRSFSFAALHLGQQNIIGNLSNQLSRAEFDQMATLAAEAYQSPDLGKVIGIMQDYFGSEKYSIWHLFRDEKRKILQQITDQSLQQAEMDFRLIYEQNYQLMTGMLNSGIPLPLAYKAAIQYILNLDLRNAFSSPDVNLRDLRHLVNEFKKWDVLLTDVMELKLAAAERLYKEMQKLAAGRLDLERLQRINQALELQEQLGLYVNLWRSQNVFFALLQEQAGQSWADPNWQTAIERLGELLRVRV